MSELEDHLKKLPVGWWGAVAGAAVAGATLFPQHRVLAGALAGAGLLALALRLTPCCDGCAAGAGCGASSPAKPPMKSIAIGEPMPDDPIYRGTMSPPTRAPDPIAILAASQAARYGSPLVNVDPAVDVYELPGSVPGPAPAPASPLDKTMSPPILLPRLAEEFA